LNDVKKEKGITVLNFKKKAVELKNFARGSVTSDMYGNGYSYFGTESLLKRQSGSIWH